MREITVDLGPRSYPVLIGRGARHELARLLPPTAKRAVVVTQQAVAEAGWLDGLDPGVPFEVCTIADGEAGKTLATVEEALPPVRPHTGSPAPTSWWPSGGASSPTWPGSPPPPITGVRPT